MPVSMRASTSRPHSCAQGQR
ncbi:hypothetical protein STIAU_5255, partial [Stigmatella aurantiaca DW4/3-1]